MGKESASRRGRAPLSLTVAGYFGFDNLGDEAMLVSLILNYTYEGKRLNLLIPRRAFRSYEMWVREEGIDDRVKLFNRWSLYQVVKAILSSEALVLGGGGLLQDETSFRSLLYYLSLGFVAKLLGRKLILERQSIGPLKRWISRLLVSWFLKLADKVTVRDTESLRLAESLGARDVLLEEDWSYSEQFLRWLSPRRDDEIKNFSYPVLWILRAWRLPEESLKLLRKLLVEFKDYSEFVAFHRADLSFYESLGISREKVFTYEGGPKGLRHVIQKLQDAKLVVSMRLHGVVFADVLSRKVIALSYSPKVLWLARDKGIPVVRVNDPLEMRKLKELILDMLNRGDVSER